jgi:hypothetical protein
VWLIVCILLLYYKRSDLAGLPPNAWGDFFAGCFAPLAFLWLVLGYLQQGEELSLSTRALLLQAAELKNSVEQQHALVEVSRQQVESERAALDYERQLREERSRPNFHVVGGGGAFRGDGHSSYAFLVTNTGSIVSALTGEMTLPDESRRHVIDLPIFERGQQHRSSLELSGPLVGSGTLALSYRDSLGREGVVVFMFSRQSEDPHSGLIFTRADTR